MFVIGVEKYGARNWVSIGGFELQPSEFVKIIYVFFIASLLAKRTDFKSVAVISIAAAVHVGILVLEKDLGAALIYFVTYLMMLYAATMKLRYLAAGFFAGTVASVVAYRLFAHVRVRVAAWQDPWSNMNQGGYQICQSLFAIGTGGLFGMGLGQGMPKSVPVVESDFIFSAIAEEMGVIFCIFLILIYISSFIMFVNIALKMKKNFYKLCAFGLSVVLIFQVFLSIGGVTKFIPSTGVTLPLISYGGSSIITTIVIFSIIQGMYVRNRREEVTTNEEQAAINRKPEKGSKRQNREMAVVTYLVMAIFFILAGYMVYFIIHDSDQVLNNSANKRQELLAKRVTKGKILSDKGKVLAKTVTDSSGNETRKYPYGSLFAHVVGRSSHGKTGWRHQKVIRC